MVLSWRHRDELDISFKSLDKTVGYTAVKLSSIFINVDKWSADIAYRFYSNVIWIKFKLSIAWKWDNDTLKIILIASAKSEPK